MLGLLAHSDTLVRASIEGLAGVGKTELAIHLAHRAAREGLFPGGIFWLDAEQHDLTLQWDSLGEAMGLSESPGAERANAALAALTASEEAALLILDNVTDWSPTKQPSPLPRQPHIRLLVTTQRGQLGGTEFKHHHLRFLPEAAARTLLVELAGRELPDAQPLLDHLEGHALAVELAGAFLQAFPEETAATYLAELTSGKRPAESVKGLVRYQATVTHALKSIWRRLDEPQRRSWRVAACFAPEPVSVALAEACGLGRQERRLLRELHLVDDAGAGRLRMHRLVRDFGLAKGGEVDRRAFVEGCLRRAAEVDEATGYRVLTADGVHLLLLVDGGPGWKEASANDCARLTERLGCALHSAGLYAPSRRRLEQALTIGLVNLGEGHARVASTRSSLASVLQSQGDFGGARELLEEVLVSCRRNLGEDHPVVARNLSNLALVLQSQGDLRGACELLELALASDIKNLDEDHPDVTAKRSNLAAVLQGLGELGRARELLELALASDIKNLDEDHPSVATSRSNLALVLQEQGDLEGARELLEKALTSYLKNLGEDHPKVATIGSNLAVVLLKLGCIGGARELLEKALAGGLRDLGEDHPEVAMRRCSLAAALREQGNLVGSRKQLEKALTSGLRCLGEHHPEVAARRSALAAVLQDQGDLRGARGLLEKVLASGLRRLGEDHPEVATMRSNLASALWKAGEYGEAAMLEKQVVTTQARQLGLDHPEVARSRINLAFTLRDLDDHESAAREAREALRVGQLQPEGTEVRTYVEQAAPLFLATSDCDPPANTS